LKISYERRQQKVNEDFMLYAYTEHMREITGREACNTCQFSITLVSAENPTVALGMFCCRSDCVHDIPLEE
jgi:hypothetical protein